MAASLETPVIYLMKFLVIFLGVDFVSSKSVRRREIYPVLGPECFFYIYFDLFQ